MPPIQLRINCALTARQLRVAPSSNAPSPRLPPAQKPLLPRPVRYPVNVYENKALAPVCLRTKCVAGAKITLPHFSVHVTQKSKQYPHTARGEQRREQT